MSTVVGHRAGAGGSADVDDAAVAARDRRESWALAGFGSWMIAGLFLDGWAHQANKPETFFSPWHGVLYSGFVAAVAWFIIDGRRAARRGETLQTGGPDRVAVVGLAIFLLGAVGDGAWHEVFGIEVDLEALLSPTHLSLMTGGLLLLSAPLRFAVRGPAFASPTRLRDFAPVVISVTLCSALATFFTMYLGAHIPIARWMGENGHALGMGSVLVRNTLLMAPLVFVLTRWRAPLGMFTVAFGLNGIAMAALNGFEFWPLAIPFLVAGVFADALITWGRGVSVQLAAFAVPAVLWAVYFLVHWVAYGVHWPAEVWTGAIYLAALSTYGLAVLLTRSGTVTRTI